MNVAKLTSKFQITIPADIRRRLGLHQGDVVVIDLEGEIGRASCRERV